MNASGDTPFKQFLDAGVDKGGFETDDILAALVPLLKQVRAAHEAGWVAPLDGTRSLAATPTGQLAFDPSGVNPPVKNTSAVEQLQAKASTALDVVAESRRVADVDQSTLGVSDRRIGVPGSQIERPVYLPGYRCWEHAVGHHDELTDIFSLGQLLGSVACGLDFDDPGELELFTTHRTNLFAIRPRLNPVIASVIVQMTELDRHRRAQDLGQLISRLENYREQAVDIDAGLLGRPEFQRSPLTGKRRLIQSHLRDRLFEISRRNRLIYFKPTLQTLNLTVASVPLVLDYRNIRLEQLFVWHPELAATLTAGAPMSLGKYLRFEDSPYIPGVLDKIIGEARRDRAEFGFAQLRLVLCFLRWNNLKEDKHERIHSPLLLLPVEVSRKKGVRDNYLLDPTTSEAEVNPALRHHLRELYNLTLPESIDLRETSLDDFFTLLQSQIRASEPGVSLNKIERPQIELIHEKARQRVDQYRRRLKISTRKARPAAKPDYSYDRQDLRPLGLQWFLEKVRPAPLPLRDAAGAPPAARLPNMAEPADSPAADHGVLEAERQMYALRDGDNANPYSWDFDLCSLTLGNFNYRKMTLVRDYAKLIETDLASGAFDAVFSLAPRPPEETPAPLALGDQHLVIACDATQASAIARARTGASYIIQGPPGTGKSQTITNLIADYVARGKRVLFVCEKRAAIDVVFHRLRQQGLDELCCLIHDSQTDKKAFIQNLRQTYEKFLGQSEADHEAEALRVKALKSMEADLAALQRFSDFMRQPHAKTGVGVRTLLHRLVELRTRPEPLAPEVEELLPDYPLWREHGDVVGRLRSALEELGEAPCFATHPLRRLAAAVLRADRPIEALSRQLDRAEELLDAVQTALELTGLPGDLWDTFDEIEVLLGFCARVRPLAERNLLGVLTGDASGRRFDEAGLELDQQAAALEAARQKTSAWRDPFPPDDTANALALARSFEGSVLRFLQPGFWRLRKTLQARYDFTRHAVPPTWTKLLEDLAAEHAARAGLEASRTKASRDWQAADPATFRAEVTELRADPRLNHPSVRGLLGRLGGAPDAGATVANLAGIHEKLKALDQVLSETLAEHGQFSFDELSDVLGELRGQTGALAELAPVLAEIADLPEPLAHALRRAPVRLDELEGAMARKSLSLAYRDDRTAARFEGRTLRHRMEELARHHAEWLGLNARSIRAAVRRQFLDHANTASLPAAQLNPDQKAFKKSYATGRRELEHEFGKTMRYRSIRDLAAGDSGQVVQDLKPIWLMSPLSVSDTLPLDPDLFDVVIFDEASQIPIEEAVPAIYRSHQAIVVGDEMQLPPTTFFATARTDDNGVVVEEDGERIEVGLDSDSFLSQSSRNLPSTLLAWHYRSRYEALISFSNAAFYSGNLSTIPDRQRPANQRAPLQVTAPEQGTANVDALLARSISFHFMENGVYEDRRNPGEAAYIARLVQGLLAGNTGYSIGIVAFSEAQQGEIEEALERLADQDPAFAARLETESVREENDVFCGLFVKNLENVQGDERDIILMSVCYGPDAGGRMLMNFGPINQRGGEKRLNVIFSRARHHMAIVSSIRHQQITNDYNDGANSLKRFLQYAEAVSSGDLATARHVLENLNPLARKALAPHARNDAVVEAIADALRQRGHEVDLHVGQSRFRCDLAVRAASDTEYRLGILVDTDGHYTNPNLLDRYLMQPGILQAFGWRSIVVLTKDWYHDPGDVLTQIERWLKSDAAETPAPAEQEREALRSDESGAAPGVPMAREIPVPTPAPAPTPGPGKKSPTAQTHVRRLVFIGGNSRKFWEIAVDGSAFTVRFGRIGTAGQAQNKTFPTAEDARRAADELTAEKLKKGYQEATSDE